MKAKEITLSAILVALTNIILYLNFLLPISTISILTLASLLIPIALIKGSIKSAFLVYIASSIIGFFILPINIILLYILFFGIYGIVKYYIEKLNKLYLEIFFKMIFFNISLFISIFIFKSFIAIEITKLPLWLLWIIAQPVFLIFDYALTLLISFYMQRIHNRI
ncbi:MAG: hypothetical protein E6300_10370 [Clostridium sp.]|uniref:hypothetical protein n=1 Tax=Clostridium sp. TaxID=1506 RepID=UPI001EBF227C|nr:hypothetical protein [Clostridium sp.]MBS5884683.1 hypothetical protein [Clostridium sp.]MDU7148881.1 hypothetical protein [Clostridium sp.]MDU7242524.1 hypothetical protein [Clostridium sp.]